MFKGKHFNAMVTKFLLLVTVLGLFLPPLGKVLTTTAVIAAIIITLVAYIIADLLVLPQYGNRAAVVADALLTMMVTWEMALLLEDVQVPILVLLLLALFVGLGEWYYHRYLARLLFRGRMKR